MPTTTKDRVKILEKSKKLELFEALVDDDDVKAELEARKKAADDAALDKEGKRKKGEQEKDWLDEL